MNWKNQKGPRRPGNKPTFGDETIIKSKRDVQPGTPEFRRSLGLEIDPPISRDSARLSLLKSANPRSTQEDKQTQKKKPTRPTTKSKITKLDKERRNVLKWAREGYGQPLPNLVKFISKELCLSLPGLGEKGFLLWRISLIDEIWKKWNRNQAKNLEKIVAKFLGEEFTNHLHDPSAYSSESPADLSQFLDEESGDQEQKLSKTADRENDCPKLSFDHSPFIKFLLQKNGNGNIIFKSMLGFNSAYFNYFDWILEIAIERYKNKSVTQSPTPPLKVSKKMKKLYEQLLVFAEKSGKGYSFPLEKLIRWQESRPREIKMLLNQWVANLKSSKMKKIYGLGYSEILRGYYEELSD